MFGFGMSAKDKWILEQAEQMLAPLALLTGEDVKPLAKKLFDEVKADAVQRYGENAYAETNGDRIIQNKAVLDKRLAAGLTVEDVRNYWNTPVLLSLMHLKVLELTDFIVIEMAEKSGKDIVEVAKERRRKEPRYGDPEKWDATKPANQGFSAEDADIYSEFQLRVRKWQAATSAEAQASCVSKFSSFNAMIRDLVRGGKL
jgi:hypothetical protein